jgi:hypothetical protein
MNYTICLDPLSLNYDPANLSGNGFSIYSDADGFTTPITVGIPASALFPPPTGTCPFMLAGVPNGATQLLIVDQCNSNIDIASIFSSENIAAGKITIDCCYSLIELDPSCRDFCEECAIGFDTYDSNTIGQIVAGNLTSSCGTITDYVIGWYLDGDYSAPALTTGFGSLAGPYQFGPHPLDGNSAVPVLAGSYEGIIHDVIINGTQYTNLASGSGKGEPIPFQSCFEITVAEPLTCDNGASPGKYSHQFDFNSQAIGTSPTPVSLTYNLDPTIKYFAYTFKGFSIYDEIEIKWKSGDSSVTSNPSLYSQPIYLEKLQVGSDTSTPGQLPNIATSLQYAVTPNTTISNLNNTWPKSTTSLAEGSYFQRVLTLTNLETSSNPTAPDFLEITITPNPNNNNTQWQAGFQCLTNFDCTNCIFDDYPNSLNNKIQALILNKQYGCDSQMLTAIATGCTPTSNPSDLVGKSIWTTTTGINDPDINLVNLHHSPVSFAQGISLGGQTSCIPINAQDSPNWTNIYTGTGICSTPTNTTITFDKTPNSIKLTFNSVNDYLHYKNALINAVSFGNSNFITPKLCSNGSVDYYQVFSAVLPFQAPSSDCGDNTTTLNYFFHINDYLNVTYIDNPQANIWSIDIPQTPIVNCYIPASCNSCWNVVNNFVTGYNSHANNSTSFSFVTNTGAKYVSPFDKHYIVQSSTGGISGSYCFTTGTQTYLRMPWYSVNTIPFVSSSNGWVNLPSLGNPLPCDLTVFSTRQQDYMYAYYGIWQVRFPHMTGSFDYSLSTNDFEIYALSGPAVPTTGSFIPWWITCPTGSLVYSYTGGVPTMHTSSYFFQGNLPTLNIAP